jgi:hypothetical protein
VWVALRPEHDTSRTSRRPVEILAPEGRVFNVGALLHAAKSVFQAKLGNADVDELRLYTDSTLSRECSPNELVAGGTYEDPLCITIPGISFFPGIFACFYKYQADYMEPLLSFALCWKLDSFSFSFCVPRE